LDNGGTSLLLHDEGSTSYLPHDDEEDDVASYLIIIRAAAARRLLCARISNDVAGVHFLGASVSTFLHCTFTSSTSPVLRYAFLPACQPCFQSCRITQAPLVVLTFPHPQADSFAVSPLYILLT
jgi:hypothetical protein